MGVKAPGGEDAAFPKGGYYRTRGVLQAKMGKGAREKCTHRKIFRSRFSGSSGIGGRPTGQIAALSDALKEYCRTPG